MHLTIRSLSSLATTFVFMKRNPLGAEENWLVKIKPVKVNPAKVAIAQIAAALLSVTAIIESVVYGAFLLLSLPLYPLTSLPMKYSIKLFSSSSFTVMWNLGNIMIFNLFYTHVVTHESIARYSFDHWPRGKFFRAIASTFMMSMNIIAIFAHRHFYLPSFNTSWQYTRIEDSRYIADWSSQNNLTNYFPKLNKA